MSITSNLNYIKNIFAHPCATPRPEVMIETAVAAVVPAIMSVTLFGCSDIMKMKRGISPWHTRALKGLVNGIATGEQLGQNRFLYASGYGTVEAALWYWMLASAATDAVANFMSMIYQEQGCAQPGAGYVTAKVLSLFKGVTEGTDMFLEPNDSKACVSVGGNMIAIPAGCSANISFSTTFVPFNRNPLSQGQIHTWIQEIGGPALSLNQAMAPDRDGVTKSGGGAKVRAPFPGGAKFYKLMFSNDHGTMGCIDGKLSVSSYGKPLKMTPGGCTPKLPDQPYPTKPVPPPKPGENQQQWITRLIKTLDPPP